jgi:hypothetical protein
MRQKTYLTPEQQWDRTVALLLAGPRYGDLTGMPIGRIVKNHRLFRAGDFVFISICNGQASRQKIYCVTSKGHVISGMYLGYREWSMLSNPCRHYCRVVRTIKDGELRTAILKFKKRCRRPLRKWRKVGFEQGPLRFIELPENLADCQPDSPPLREYILALARKGWRTPGKRE